MKNKSNLGFTLIELMIVTEIIAILVAISVPSLIRTRIQSNEASAVGNLRMIGTGEITYNLATGSFGTLEKLCEGDDQATAYVSGKWSNGGVRNQYNYICEPADITDSAFLVTAKPVSVNRTAIRTYKIDETGEIRYQMPGEAEDVWH